MITPIRPRCLTGTRSSRVAASVRVPLAVRAPCASHRTTTRSLHAATTRAAEGEAPAAAEPAGIQYDLDDLDTAKSAIDLGQAVCAEGRWAEALAIFEKALSLPGTGLKRFRDKPRLISDGEKCAALFNVACCHSRMGDVRSGLVALAGCLEAGYEDFAQVRGDPDLEALRADERFEQLMSRFERKPRGGLFGGFFGNRS